MELKSYNETKNLHKGIKTTSQTQHKICLQSGKLFEHSKGKNHYRAAKPGKSLNEYSELQTRQYSLLEGL